MAAPSGMPKSARHSAQTWAVESIRARRRQQGGGCEQRIRSGATLRRLRGSTSWHFGAAAVFQSGNTAARVQHRYLGKQPSGCMSRPAMRLAPGNARPLLSRLTRQPS